MEKVLPDNLENKRRGTFVPHRFSYNGFSLISEPFRTIGQILIPCEQTVLKALFVISF